MAQVFRLDVAVARLADQLGIATQAVTEKLALDLHKKITERTPVDTGRARSSWNISEGAPDTTVPPETGVESTGKYSQQSSPPPNTVPPPTPEITGTKAVYITSSLEYVQYLEEGSSKQAPAGMVTIALAEVEAEIDQIIASAIQ